MPDHDHPEGYNVQTNPWLLHTEERQPWLRAYLGNGRLAVQLVAEGGLAGHHGQPLHLMAELYDRAEGYEVEHPVPLPGWSSLRLTADGVPLDPDAASAYHQDLDLRRGLAHTHWRWSIGNTEITVTTQQAVLRHEPNLALIQLTVCATTTCLLEITAGLQLPHDRPAAIEDQGHSVEDGLVSWIGASRERGIPLAVMATLVAQDQVGLCAQGQTRVQLALQPDQPQQAHWLVAARFGPVAREAALADLRRGRAFGFDRLLADHIAAWEVLWHADVQIAGAPDVQRFVRAGLFALLCSINEGVEASIAPMGLSSLGYNGHIFWDADTWMFPPLLLLHPKMARSMLAYRQNRLPAAYDRARVEGYAGAMFPWESATDGLETTPVSIARTGLKEHHITACVALAQWQYYLATSDNQWLAAHGWPVLEAAAQFWVSRVTPGPRGYEIRDVIAADEYAEDVDNDAFTNGAARAALLAALAAAAVLGRSVPPEWQIVANGLVLARDGDLVLEFDGYDGQTIKQGDVELLTFPLEYPLNEAEISRNLEIYRRVTDPEGPAMGRAISAVVAAQLGQREEASSLFTASYEPHLWGPFCSLAETRSNGQTNFLTGVGGALQTLLFGFAGIRLHRNALAVDPFLPVGWQGLHLPALHWRGQILSLSVLPGDCLELSPCGSALPFTLVLHRWRPGPAPLHIAVRAAEGVQCILEARDWRIEPAASGRAWQLHPPTAEPSSAFVPLKLTATDPHSSVVLEIEQRVRSGDD